MKKLLFILILFCSLFSEGQIAFGSSGATATGTTTVTQALPTVFNAGDLFLDFISTKHGSPTVSAGWTLFKETFGGLGAAAADAGIVYVLFHHRHTACILM